MKNIKESRQLGNVQVLRKIFKGGGESRINHLRHKLSMAKYLTTGGVQIHQNHAYVILE